MQSSRNSHCEKSPASQSDPASQSSEETHLAYQDLNGTTKEPTLLPPCRSCRSKVLVTSHLTLGTKGVAPAYSCTTVPSCSHAHQETDDMFEPNSRQAASFFSKVFSDNVKQHLPAAMLLKKATTTNMLSPLSIDESKQYLGEFVSDELYRLHESFFPDNTPKPFDVNYLKYHQYRKMAFPSALKELSAPLPGTEEEY